MLYTLLTSLIIALAKLRKRVARNWDFRLERDEPLIKVKNLDIQNYRVLDGAGRVIGMSPELPYVQNRLECCDCGLTHGLYIDEKGFLRTVPWRPGVYHYKMRLGR